MAYARGHGDQPGRLAYRLGTGCTRRRGGRGKARPDVFLRAATLECVANQVRDAPDEANNLAVIHFKPVLTASLEGTSEAVLFRGGGKIFAGNGAEPGLGGR